MLLRQLFRTVIEDSIYGYVRQEQIEPSYKTLSLVVRKDVDLEKKKASIHQRGRKDQRTPEKLVLLGRCRGAEGGRCDARKKVRLPFPCPWRGRCDGDNLKPNRLHGFALRSLPPGFTLSLSALSAREGLGLGRTEANQNQTP